MFTIEYVLEEINRSRVSIQERINGFYVNQEINRLTCHLKGHPQFHPCDENSLGTAGNFRSNSDQSHLWRGCWSLLPSGQGAIPPHALQFPLKAQLLWRISKFLTPVVWRFLFWGFWGALRCLQPGLSITGQKSGLSLALSLVSLFLYCLFSLSWLLKIFKHLCLPCGGFVPFY